MYKLVLTTITFVFIASTAVVKAQNNKKQPCFGEKYGQFDFWEGNWNVYNTKGELIGTNNLVKMQSNCIMQENWVSKTSSNKGTSYNYYNKVDDSWNQVWIDNTGYSLVLKGGLVNGKMVLKSKLVRGKNGDYINRVTWSKNKDNSVTQVWDYLDKNGKILSEAFRGIYKKKTK